MEGNNKRVIKKIAIVLLILFALLLYSNLSWFMRYLYPLKFEDIIVKNSAEYNIDPYLIAAVIKVESGFSPNVVSKKSAKGLMQIMPDTATWAADQMKINDFALEDLIKPDVNIKIGTWYLSTLMDEYDCNITLVLAAYNGGRGNVNEWIKNGKLNDNELKNGVEEAIPFSETKNFVKKVKTAYKWYKRLYTL